MDRKGVARKNQKCRNLFSLYIPDLFFLYFRSVDSVNFFVELKMGNLVKCVAFFLFLLGFWVFSEEPLYWTGGVSGVWSTEEPSWGVVSNVCPWISGSQASFTNAASVQIDEMVTLSAVTANETATNLFFSGSGSASFSSGGGVFSRLENDLHFSVPVLGTNAFFVNTHAKTTLPGFLSPSNAVVFSGFSLHSVTGFTARMSGGHIRKKGVSAYVISTFQDDGSLRVRFVCLDDVYYKCVLGTFRQVGEEIYVTDVSAKYTTSNDSYDYDFEKNGTVAKVSTEHLMDGYGVYEIQPLFREPLGSTHFQSGVTVTGAARLTLGRGPVEIGPNGTLNEGAFSGVLTNDSALTFSAPASLGGTLAGDGSFHFSVTGGAWTVVADPEFFPNGTDWQVLFTNQVLANLRTLSGTVYGGWVNHDIDHRATPFCFLNDGREARVDLQVYDPLGSAGHVKSVVLELRQSGRNIEVKVQKAQNARSEGVNLLGFDSQLEHDGSGSTLIATNASVDGYGVCGLVGHFGETATWCPNTSTATGNVIVDGCTLSVSTSYGPQGDLSVVRGGRLLLNANTRHDLVGCLGVDRLVTISNGSVLETWGNLPIGLSMRLLVDGGTVTNTGVGVDWNFPDGRCYLNRMTLKDGALVCGRGFRIGAESGYAKYLCVTGTTPSVISSEIVLVRRYDTMSDSVPFIVHDVTGDPKSDLTISGCVRDYSDERSGMAVVKSGAGTLLYARPNTYTGRTEMAEGVLRLGVSGAVSTNSVVAFSGGGLTVAAGTEQHVGALCLLTGSENRLTLEEGATIAFQDSSAETWPETARLEVVRSDLLRCVRVGTNATALTAAQCGAIRCGGKPVALSDDGYLFVQSGTLFLLR